MASRTTGRRGLPRQIHVRARSLALLSLWYALAGSSRLRQADCDCLLTVADGLARTTALELPSLHLVHRPLDFPAACFAVLARHRLTPPFRVTGCSLACPAVADYPPLACTTVSQCWQRVSVP